MSDVIGVPARRPKTKKHMSAAPATKKPASAAPAAADEKSRVTEIGTGGAREGAAAAGGESGRGGGSGDGVSRAGTEVEVEDETEVETAMVSGEPAAEGTVCSMCKVGGWVRELCGIWVS